uniref:Putative gypsy52-i ag n=1 Tax=Anopheles marajoara TaxID=58244 RepID=A0A2M4BUR1_9DIPT
MPNDPLTPLLIDVQSAGPQNLATPLPTSAPITPRTSMDADIPAPPTTSMGNGDRLIETVKQYRINPPELNLQDLSASFWALENWFTATGVGPNMDARRYRLLVSQIPTRALTEVQPLIDNPPQEGSKYEYAKKAMKAYYEETQRQKINRLLGELEMGDEKPSKFLADMRRAAGDAMSESIIVDLWTSRLPPCVQSAVIATRGSTNEKANVADAVMDSLTLYRRPTPQPLVNEVRNRAFESNVTQLLTELSKKIEDLTLATRNTNTRNTENHRTYRGSHDRQQGNRGEGRCYYHERFGNQARHCRPPCTFNNAQSQGRDTTPPQNSA